MDANYGIGIAKLRAACGGEDFRAARRLWAEIQTHLGLDPAPMKLRATTSAREHTRYDPWVNILRGTAACFAAATGGADIINVRAFNEAMGVPEELGRRIARNTQIIAMEESGLGRVADPSGGAWFTETLSEDLAVAAWSEFQQIEREGGLVQSLMDGALQARIGEARKTLFKNVAHRKIPITGVSEFPTLDEVPAPIAEFVMPQAGDGIDQTAIKTLLGDTQFPSGGDTCAEPLTWVRLSEPFESLRDAASGKDLSIFLATLGPVAEHTARADFARNLFAAGGLAAKEAPVPPQSPGECAAAFKASGCTIAVICGSDARYTDEAEATAAALKQAGAQHIWLAGKGEFARIDRNIFMGCDIVHELKLAHAELGA